MDNVLLTGHIGKRISLPGHFDVPVILEDARPLGSEASTGYECRVRLPNGSLEEAVVSATEAASILEADREVSESAKPVDADKLRLLVESSRIHLAYAHDRQFAVSLSGIRTLPHQIEAVYQAMLPQSRLRFLLADDPGAGKTIMAGLLVKELKLREAIERVLILCPAPLTIQWQDEMLRWFGEPFDIIFSAVDQQQLTNPWQRSSQIISSIDYAKQEDVRERVWQQRWDLMIIDEAHKCSARTASGGQGREPKVVTTKRYDLASRLTSQADHVLLLTATPHHGDEDKFAHFLRLIDPDLFPEPHKLGKQVAAIRKDVFRLGKDSPWSLRRLKEDLKDFDGKRLFPDRHTKTVTFCLNSEEYALYKDVAAYINEFIPQQMGQRRSSAALTRTVLQRRLVSSTCAIHESLKRRQKKQQDLLEEMEGLSPAQRARRLAALLGRLPDAEQEEDDLDETSRDQLVDEYTAALELEQLRAEIAALEELVEQARRVRENANDSKLSVLRKCLGEAQFLELKDGRGKMLKELGVQNDYDPVITADIDGPNARAKRIDKRMAGETPALASVKPATRIATSILLYSFGGLRREGSGDDETLPPGVTEAELLAACVGPDLDNITATAVLSELRTSCLYLHYDGVRYCFKKDPNVTKLIEDAEQSVSREDAQAKANGPVRGKIKEMLDARLAGHHNAQIWPAKSQDIPDEDPLFLVGYLPLEFAGEGKSEQERHARELLSKYGDKPRRYRNGVGLAIPSKKQIEALRRAIRYLLAIERVEAKKRQLRLTKDQLDQLKERKRTEQAAAEFCFRELYTAVWLPRVVGGEFELEKVERGGRPLQATGVHERIMELLTSVGTPRIHDSVTPRKIAERVKLGESVAEGEPPIRGIRTSDVLEAFFRDIASPRLESADVLRKGIARGIAEGVFAYTSGGLPKLGEEGRFQVTREKVVVARPLAEDEVDFDSGFLMVPSAVPEALAVPTTGTTEGGSEVPPTGPEIPIQATGPEVGPTTIGGGGVVGRLKQVSLVFNATRNQIFKAFPAVANLADKSDEEKVKIRVEGTAADGYDPAWLRNAVEEPLDEADIEQMSEDKSEQN